ncbi:hypothetical protein TNCV_2315121 [Trichonephila clavipes]|nr:hypothetical protein TNCV_2315121 [Trichonephila clavipes]
MNIQGGPEFMVQTLMVDTGHCNNHLLYRNVWAQVKREGANKGNKRDVTGSRAFSLTCPLDSLGPELMATLFQPNPRSEGKMQIRKLLNIRKKPASDPKNVVIHSSENQLAAFKNFVVIHSRHRKSANRQPPLLIFCCKKMAFLLSKKKEDLKELAEELGLIVEAGLTKPKLKDLIVKSPDYVEEDVKVMFDSIVKDRIRTEKKRRNCDEKSENMN